ncbi:MULTISPECIES: transposase [unclassified Streptomyces]|uniref:transposase n=1 Tax=unclassified Streptomyces TaxID=2593676 RepID=UPI00037563C5|nr:transposase [Streptomyces sp. KhCrAH-43]MYS35589.1 helix-turn-helix domain-containing protein [Streptomyces sp. SID4920]MYX68666.1 helix-turn-helix domain-containing protein [Streptomyces sp. SID8373]
MTPTPNPPSDPSGYRFAAVASRLIDSSGRTVTAVARDLGISSESLRGWYRRAKADQGEGPRAS